MTRAAWWGHAVRWFAALALGGAAFEGLDALAGQNPMVSWITLVSPML